MNDVATISAELERAGEVIDTCGESARQGQSVDLSGLDSTVETLCQAIAGLPESECAPLKLRLIDLIDRLNKLVGDLEAQQASISGDIKDLSSRHRAVSAYGKGANTTPRPDRKPKR